jgi:hypothetical protein
LTPAAYSEIVIAERAALRKLQRLEKAWGSKDHPTLAEVASAWDTWAKLAAALEREHGR